MKIFYLLIFSFFLNISANAKGVCTGRMHDPLSGLSWDCLFPISIGAAPVSAAGANRPDTPNFPSPICVCPEKFGGLPIPGLAVGFWEPVRMVDVTKRPFCMVNMGGIKMAPEGFSIVGTGADEEENEHNAMWHLHWYINPAVFILNWIMDALCLEASGFDLAYLTELDPLYNDDELSFILNPEAILFGNPIAQAACAADCIASTVHLPWDPLFWCAGCQGGTYPFTGNNNAHRASLQSTTLTVEKFMAKLHRQMMLMVTSGPEAICMPYPSPIIKKSQYRLQTTYPVVGYGPFSCNPYGKSTVLHEMGKEIPITGEDFGFFVWRKRNCCML